MSGCTVFVTGCNGCPLLVEAQGEASYCAGDAENRRVNLNFLTTAAPYWCPVKNGPLTFVADGDLAK